MDVDTVATAQSKSTVHPLLIFDNGSNVCESNEFMEASPLQELVEQYWNSDGSARIPANHDNSKVTTLHELHVSSHTKYNFARIGGTNDTNPAPALFCDLSLTS